MNNYPKRSEMKFRYERVTQSKLNVFEDDALVAVITGDGFEPMVDIKKKGASKDDVKDDFKLFMNHPAYPYGRACHDTDYLDYDALIAGYFFTLYDDEKAEKMTDRCLEWLHGTDFFTAPASTQYHDSFEGGLVYHSINVYNKMLELLLVPSFGKVSWKDALITALVHDWCKIGLYESYFRNVKNDVTGQWEQVKSFRHAKTQIPMGHGTTSMFMANKFIKLSTEQALAIRWHMGVYQVSDTEKPDLFRSNEAYPMVYLLQFADQLSITEYQTR